MAELDTSVRYIKGIGEKKAQALGKLGVSTLRGLVSFFPRKYEDRSVYKPIAFTENGESVCVRAMVATTPNLVRARRGMELVKFRAVDDSGSMDVTYFNQSYMRDNFRLGESYIFFGRIEYAGGKRSMVNPVCEREGAAQSVTGRLVPIYRVCAGLSQRVMLQSIRQGLDACGGTLPEPLPETVRVRMQLCSAAYAYENIHFPADLKALELARSRLIFEELFVLACALGRMRSRQSGTQGAVMPRADMRDFYRALPFSPTGAQLAAIEQGLADMESGLTMNRLVQGDVGSGKTLVACALIYNAWKSGYMSAFMAPTEILAEQHYNTLSSLLAPFPLRIALLTGGTPAAEKRRIKAALKSGELDLVIGTHALLSEDVDYPTLGLVVTDEQHRFGVKARSALIGKGQHPHVLVMSATPIPRTLALIIYGDLEVSVIDELPPGRQRVDTFAVDESYRQRLDSFIEKQCAQGRQVFVVCPMVEENEELPQDIKSAQERAQYLSERFPRLRVQCIHGKLKTREKERIMSAFARGEIDILVATTVIEVGVDVPNAALMIIENAERFGLSQLHQLRGRVGRGEHKSYCILVSDCDGEEAKARLSIMTKTSDGFKISEEDLRLRGPGDFFGARQHGLPEMHVADLGADARVLQNAQQEARLLLEADCELDAPEHRQLRERIDALFQANADSFN